MIAVRCEQHISCSPQILPISAVDKESEVNTSVAKKYTDFMDEISSDELYEGLLAYGLFTEKLPPVFTAVPFFDYCKTASHPFKDNNWSDYITFRVMRNIGIPRLMGIPNPFAYQRACAELRDSWDEICKHFHKQTDGQSYRISRIHIRKKFNEKRIFKMNYKNWQVDGNPESDLLIHDRGTSRFLVKADLSTCFPSIYTHSISWALVGKERAKQTIGSQDWYNKIDQVCSNMRNGETHGLLIGPHTSNLLSEIILTVIDKKLYDKGYRYVRNIDDYDCYVGSYDEVQRFLRDLESALREFDLSLNHKKTKVIELPIGIEKNWIHQLSDLPKVGKSGMVEYPQVNTYIDTALMLAAETGDFAVINWAIKKLKREMKKGNLTLTDNGKKLAAKRFMHMAVLHPYLLHLMEEYVFMPYGVDKNGIVELSNRVFQDACKINDYESLCYSIYFAVKFDFALDGFEDNWEEAQNYVIESRDCLLLVMTWIYFVKQNHGNRNATQVKPLKREAMKLKKTDMDRYWLFCYEALKAGSLPSQWRSMKQAGVSFIRKEIIN